MSASNENLNPAVLKEITVPDEMSPEKFRQNLLAWFESRGIVSELRAHLRHHMIEVLKDSSIRNSLETPLEVSPKTHAINLLIAEYFVQHNYHYTISVFCAEIPLTAFSEAGSSNKADNSKSSRFYFSEKNFWDIVDAMGFTNHTMRHTLYNLYYKKMKGPLLVCMLLLHAKDELKKPVAYKDLNSLEPWMKDLHNLLIHFDIPEYNLVRMRDNIKDIVEKERTKIRNELSDCFNNVHDNIQKDMEQKETNICNIISEMEETFFKEKQKLIENFEKEKTELKTVFAQKDRDYEEKYNTLQCWEELLTQRENEVLEQMETIKQSNKKVETFRECTVQKILVKTQDKLIQTEKSEDQVLINGLLEQLKIENARLRALNAEQHRQLEETTIQNTRLSSDLENTQRTINVLNRGLRTPDLNPATPAPPPIMLATAHQQIIGGGENLAFNPRPRSFANYRHLMQQPLSRDSRRKVPRRLVLHNVTDSSSSSNTPTEEVLQEARLRLRRLEQETEEVDRNYREYRKRQARRVQKNLERTFHFEQRMLNNTGELQQNGVNIRSQPTLEVDNDANNDQLAAHSGISSGVLPLLNNLSISNIDVSSDTDHANDETSPHSLD